MPLSSLFSLAAPFIVAPFIGSFLGVLIMRLPAGRGIGGRSDCDVCHHVLAAADLVPIASWLHSRGRCCYCGAALGLFYPAIELAAFVVPLWSWIAAPDIPLWASCLLGWGLLTLALIDWRDGVLPNALTLPLLLIGLAVTVWLQPNDWQSHVIGSAAGYLALEAIRLAYRRLRGRDGMGGGDPRLLAALGAWTGWTGLPGIVFIAALATLAVVAILPVTGKPIRRDRPLPFGPGLCLAGWLVWLYGPLRGGPA